MNTSNIIIGVNGSTAWNEEGCGKMVALFTSLTRGLNVNYIHGQIDKIIKDCNENAVENIIEDLVVLAFQTRDIRGGKGERKLFYDIFSQLINYIDKLKNGKERLKKLIKLIGEYGCWNDLWSLMDSCQKIIIDIVAEQLIEDEHQMAINKNISLLAKWMPREREKKQIEYVDLIRKKLGISRKNYRKRVSALNKYLKTVEINMCGGTWADIIPNTVPGRNMHLHKKAFLNENNNNLILKLIKRHGSILYNMHTNVLAELRQKYELRYPNREDRMKCRANFIDFFSKVSKGKEKIKGADTLMPHEIINAIMDINHYNESDPTMQALEGQWKIIGEKFNNKLDKIICLADFSGSMSELPMMISMALGILISEKTGAAFKNRLITFSDYPSWIEFEEGDSLWKKVYKCHNSPWGGSTNFEAAYKLVLQRMIDERVKTGAEPDDLVVLTDMGWDQATRGHAFHLDALKDKFKKAGEQLWGEGNGWKVPRVIIWNLREQFKHYQATENTPGVVMISGWHPSILKKLIEGVKVDTPWDGLRLILDDVRYDLVRKAFASTTISENFEID
jgi:hypothetical protein